MFVGSHRATIGADGMLALPEDWRAAFGKSGILFAGRDVQGGTIGLFPRRRFEDGLAQLDEKVANKIRQDFLRVTMDSSGRFVLPAELLEWAKIDSAVEMVGCIDHIKVRRWKRVAPVGLARTRR